MDIIFAAKEIALEDLRACYHSPGILASQINFSDFWARDTFWASIGLLKQKIDVHQVKNSLDLFSRYQRSDGKIPRKICLDYNGLKYFGIKIKRTSPRPIYTSSIKSFASLDDNLLFVIAFCEYIKTSRDISYAKTHFHQATKALFYYASSNLIKEALLHETGFANWMDTIFKRGFVLYTNCLWFEALRSFEQLKEMLQTQDKNPLLPQSQEVFNALQKKFWLHNDGFFADSVSKGGKKDEHFDLAGNVLAILFDLANKKQAELIFKTIETIKTKQPEALLHPLNYPLYPFWRISPFCFLFNIQDYQNGISWSWIEVLLAAAYSKHGKIKQAKEALENISKVVTANKQVHETYYLDGKPFDHLLWKSAAPFAWGAGLFLYAIAVYQSTSSEIDEEALL